MKRATFDLELTHTSVPLFDPNPKFVIRSKAVHLLLVALRDYQYLGGAVHMSRPARFERILFTYCIQYFRYIFKLHSYRSIAGQAAWRDPAETKRDLASYMNASTNSYINVSSGPARLNQAGSNECTHAHFSSVNFKYS